jgi:hypothetical protein
MKRSILLIVAFLFSIVVPALAESYADSAQDMGSHAATICHGVTTHPQE